MAAPKAFYSGPNWKLNISGQKWNPIFYNPPSHQYQLVVLPNEKNCIIATYTTPRKLSFFNYF